MRILSFTIILGLLFIIAMIAQATRSNNSKQEWRKQSPHGKDFKISCNVCHSAKGWELDKDVYSFDHNKTKFPLVGQHNDAQCRSCHTSLVFSEAKTECKSCHADIHQSTTGKDCQQCHTPYSWLVNNTTKFHQLSRFPLVGVHAKVDCDRCHKSESLHRYDVIGSECYSCHADNYAATTQPNHASAGFSTQCNTCHHVFSDKWSTTGFNHNSFPLTSGHALTCNQCHTTGTYTKLPTECVSCHLSNYNSTTNPNHVTANFPKTCNSCHTTAPGWKPASFDHSKFPLTQGHAINDCSKCHINGNYTNTSSNCYSCHQADYTATTNPNHVTGNFSTTCSTCHSTAPGWKPASYNHSKFPLTQGHAITDCSKCHINGNYTNTSTNCYSCHQADYNATSNPSHSKLGFSTTCTGCHTTAVGWKPATYTQHDALSFPIYSGKHRGTWSSCTDCHTNTSNYSSFNCLNCHAHNKTDMDDSHSGVKGYSYNSVSCLNCHPRP